MATKGYTAAVVFLHGSGDTGRGIREWLGSVSRGAWERKLQASGIKAVYPTAPAIPYTLNGGFPQTVWFDRLDMAYDAPEDKAGIQRSIEAIDKEIDKLVAEGIPLDRIAVSGNSMGACLALHVGYGSGRHSGKVGAVSAFSTFIAEDSDFDAVARARFVDGGAPAPPLFMSHGSADRMIQPAWARATRDRLAACGVPAPAQVPMWPGMGHDMCEPEVKELIDFLLAHLAVSPECAAWAPKSGEVVRFEGLKTSELNGVLGLVKAFDDEQQRWQVSYFSEADAKAVTKSFKVSNLALVDGSATYTEDDLTRVGWYEKA